MVKQLIKNWLDIKEPTSVKAIEKMVKDLDDKAFAKAKNEYKFNANQLKSFAEVKCDGCKKSIITYPFGGGYYTRATDNKRYHSSKCLDNNT